MCQKIHDVGRRYNMAKSEDARKAEKKKPQKTAKEKKQAKAEKKKNR